MKDHIGRQLYIRTAAQPNWASYDVEALTEQPGIRSVPLAAIQGAAAQGWPACAALRVPLNDSHAGHLPFAACCFVHAPPLPPCPCRHPGALRQGRDRGANVSPPGSSPPGMSRRGAAVAHVRAMSIWQRSIAPESAGGCACELLAFFPILSLPVRSLSCMPAGGSLPAACCRQRAHHSSQVCSIYVCSSVHSIRPVTTASLEITSSCSSAGSTHGRLDRAAAPPPLTPGPPVSAPLPACRRTPRWPPGPTAATTPCSAAHGRRPLQGQQQD